MDSIRSPFFTKFLDIEILTCSKSIGIIKFGMSLLLSFYLLASATCVAELRDGGYQDYLNFEKEYLVKLQEESLEKSKDPEATQQAFVELFRKYISGKANLLGQQNWEELHRDAEAFLKLKPKEPFSQVAAGWIIIEAGKNTNILDNCKMIEKAASKLENYSLEARLYAAKAVHETVYVADFRKGKSPQRIFNQHLDLLIEWMSQSEDPPEYLQRMMFEEGHQFINHGFTTKFDMLPVFEEKFTAASDKITPWLNNVLLAELHRKRGWDARGGGFADTVDKDDWAQFEESLDLAKEKLQLAYQLHPERPEAASMMVAIAMASETEDDTRTWFDRAVAAEFDCIPAYNYYLASLLPRWGGSHEAMIDFANECANTGRYDTRVPMVWKTCFRHIFEDSNREDQSDPLRRRAVAYMRQYDVLPTIQVVSEKYQAYLKQQGGYSIFDTSYYRAWEFSVAYKLRQLDDAYEIYKKYDGDVEHPRIVTEYAVPGDVPVAHVVAANGAAADEVADIDDKTHPLFGKERTARESKKLLQKIEEAMAKNDLPAAKLYFEIKKELLEKEVDFHRGNWVNLNFTPELFRWSNYGGRYDAKSSTSLSASSSSQEYQYLCYNTSFPPPYEVELTVEGIDCYFWRKHLPAGIVCGRMHGPKTGRFFWVDTLTHLFGCTAPDEFTSGFSMRKDKSIQIKVNVFDGYYEMFDGESYIIREDKEFEPGVLGVALTPWRTVSGEVRYSDFRIRKLNYSKPPPAEDAEARLAYYKKRLKTDKTYLAHSLLAGVQLSLKRYKDSLDSFKAAEALSPNNPLAASGVADSLYMMQRDAEAVQAFERTLKNCVGVYKFKRPSTLVQLIWLYSSSPDDAIRDGEKAVLYAKELLKTKTKRSPLTWKRLNCIAAAFAEAGQFNEAIEHVQSAIELAQKSDQDKVDDLEKKLKLYQDGKPYRMK